MTTLRQGSRGDAVKSLQRTLGLVQDGIYGPATEKAVRSFQQESGLTVDGIAGPATLAALGKLDSTSAQTSSTAAASPSEAKRPGPKFGLVVWHANDLIQRKDWQSAIKQQGWDFVSVKICQGTEAIDPEATRSLVDSLHCNGTEVHGWGYHLCQDVASAQKEGTAAGKLCADLGIRSYHWDAETEWKAGSPEASAIAFAESMRAIHPEVAIWANCLSEPLTASAVHAFDGWEPQLYGTRASTIAHSFSERLNKFGEDLRRAAMVGTGRIDESGNVWGYLEDQSDAPGLVTLVRQYNPYMVSFFRAPYMLDQGNAHNPALAEQISRIRAC